jgi:hypothetical protein
VNTENPTLNFEEKKGTYFYGLCREVRLALELHQKPLETVDGNQRGGGLWDRINGERIWRNVSEHCMVEVARVGVLGQWLGLPDELVHDLKLAAAFHDFNKRRAIEITVPNAGTPKEGTEQAGREATQIIREYGVSPRVLDILKILEDKMISETGKMAKKSILTDLEKAQLVMRYVDDYTMGSDWVEMVREIDGNRKNALDQRVDNNETKPKYVENSQQWRSILGGESLHEAQRRCGHAVEYRLTSLINEEKMMQNPIIDSLDLPYVVDQEIRSQIASIK